ncbi:hypothetical protein M8J76_000856 [Diaphorina citri]|nr:hypothetical protein M8J76_000856 [Diaphorina citri]
MSEDNKENSTDFGDPNVPPQYSGSPEKSCENSTASSAGATGSNKVESTQIVSGQSHLSMSGYFIMRSSRS